MSAENKPSILIVDDEPSNLKVLNQILSSEYDVLTVQNGQEALEVAAAERPDLILLDIIMPDMSGFDVLIKLKELQDTIKIPIIFITGLTSEDDEEKGLLLGAADYIRKPFRNVIVRARIKTQMQNLMQRKEIELLSMIDALTNIPNRRSFDIRLDMEWSHAIREKLPISMLMMDVDKFKIYNDTYGHPQGDALLKAVAGVFRASAKRAGDMAARLGGEEFAVLLPNTQLEGALATAEQIRLGVEATVVKTVDGKPTSATISIGVESMIPGNNDHREDFVARADACLYAAKKSGRNRVYFEGK
jgi:diguanylate cyclase (GGDEF)-like protein